MHGILTSNCRNITLNSNKIEHCGFGIYCINGGMPVLSGNEISNISNSAIFSHSTPSIIRENKIKASKKKVGIFISTDPAPLDVSRNTIKDVGYGIYVSNTSYALLVNNVIEGTDISTVHSDTRSIVEEDNTITQQGTGKTGKGIAPENVNGFQDLVQLELNRIGVNSSEYDGSVEQIYEEALMRYNEHDFSQALEIFRSLILQFSSSKYARQSLRYITSALEVVDWDIQQKREYWKELINASGDESFDVDLREYIEIHDVYWANREKNHEETENGYNNLIEKHKDEEICSDLLYGKALLHMYEKQEAEKKESDEQSQQQPAQIGEMSKQDAERILNSLPEEERKALQEFLQKQYGGEYPNMRNDW